MTSRRLVVLAGVGSGLGRTLAYSLAAKHLDLVLVARGAAALHELADEITNDAGISCLAVPADVTTRQGVDDVFRVVDDSGADLVGMVHSLTPSSPDLPVRAADHDVAEAWAATVAASTYSALRFGAEAGTRMAKLGDGAIVYVTALAALAGAEGMVAHAAAKASINAVGLTLARELGGDGIRVNAVAPNVMDGVALKANLAELDADSLVRSYVDDQIHTAPLKRLPTEEEVSSVIAFLLGEGGSGVTGQIIPVTCGAGAV